MFHTLTYLFYLFPSGVSFPDRLRADLVVPSQSTSEPLFDLTSSSLFVCVVPSAPQAA